jgi:cullin-associated NEDD8-dissociated protein 1
MNIVRVAEMSSQLFEKVLNGTDRYQDTSSIALKAVVAEVSTQSIAQRNNPILTLINGIMEEFSGVQVSLL